MRMSLSARTHPTAPSLTTSVMWRWSTSWPRRSSTQIAIPTSSHTKLRRPEVGMIDDFRDADYWRNLVRRRGGGIRHMPPSEGIPVTTAEDHRLVRDCRRRYMVAVGLHEANG